MDKEHILMQKHVKIKKIREEKVDPQKVKIQQAQKYKIKWLFLLGRSRLNPPIKNFNREVLDNTNSKGVLFKRHIKRFASRRRWLHLLVRQPEVLSRLVRIKKIVNRWRVRHRVKMQTYRFKKKQQKRDRRNRRPWRQEPIFYHRYLKRVLEKLHNKKRKIIRWRRKLLIASLKTKSRKYPRLPSAKLYYRFRHKDHQGCIITMRARKNNFIITAINASGEVIVSYNAGKCGAKGAKKSLPFTAQECAKKMAQYLKQLRIKNITLIAKSRMKKKLKEAVKSLMINKLHRRRIISRIAVPHNGIRAKKTPRK